MMEKKESSIQRLFSNVVDGGYCIGCGGCASVKGSAITMQWQPSQGVYKPRESGASCGTPSDGGVERICPFYAPDDEDSLGASLFAASCGNHDRRIGYFKAVFAGHVDEGEYRAQGSSGGMVTWVLKELLERKLIDGVIHVGATDPKGSEGVIFKYKISRDLEQLTTRAKSRYYPVEFSQVIRLIRNEPGRYAFVGVPCFVKAIRLLAKNDPDIEASISFCVAIFCGHMKTAGFADSIGWQLGIPPGHLSKIDFRRKHVDRPANQYGIRAVDVKGAVREEATKNLYGLDWGLGLFKPNACDFCDDIAGELADIACGDAWLPEYVNDGRGSNIVVVRNPLLLDIIQDAREAGALSLDSLGPDDVYRSQAGNYRHRRDGLAYRLWLMDQRKIWRPEKRVTPQYDHLTVARRRIYRLRSQLSMRSHEAFVAAQRSGRFSSFKKKMTPLVSRYYRANRVYLRYIAKTSLRNMRNYAKTLKDRVGRE